MKSTNHSFKEKVIEIIVEIFIIVFAVTLSIWLHGWSEHRHQQQEVKEFLTDLKEDLKNDAVSYTRSKDGLAANLKDYQFCLSLAKNQVDSLKKVHGSLAFHSSISTTKINNGNYEGFKSSGKIGYIENKQLKRQILKYYQEQTPGLLEIEQYGMRTFDKVLGFISANADKGIDEIIVLPQFKQALKMHSDNATGLSECYTQSLKDATTMIKEIEDLEK
jgi:Family of unknown function (DUF6090)